MDQNKKPALPNIPPVQFVREVAMELKKVTWPTRQETVKLTIVVIAVSVIVGIFIGIVDATFLSLTSVLFQK
jgi:preprotein translocase subunit SecE